MTVRVVHVRWYEDHPPEAGERIRLVDDDEQTRDVVIARCVSAFEPGETEAYTLEIGPLPEDATDANEIDVFEISLAFLDAMPDLEFG